MTYLTAIIEFVRSDAGIAILAALLTLSEALASIPAIQANSVFQLVKSGLQALTKRS
jgi:hypothetical protein